MRTLPTLAIERYSPRGRVIHPEKQTLYTAFAASALSADVKGINIHYLQETRWYAHNGRASADRNSEIEILQHADVLPRRVLKRDVFEFDDPRSNVRWEDLSTFRRNGGLAFRQLEHSC